MDVRRIFTEIYTENRWKDPESRSGPGSSVYRTRLIRPALSRLLRELGVRSVLDVPCGDFNWMRLTDIGEIHYIGIDVVPGIVHRNTCLFADERVSFLCLDMIEDALPSADLILCRDGLVHLSFADIGSALRQMRQSQAKYLLTTTFDAHTANLDIATGDWRPLNLRLPPLGFPQPITAIWDGPRPDGSYADKLLALYNMAEIPPL